MFGSDHRKPSLEVVSKRIQQQELTEWCQAAILCEHVAGGNMIKLTDAQTGALLEHPETGMGYQIVEVETAADTKPGTVFNAELLLWHDESIPDPAKVDFETLVKKADDTTARNFRSIRVLVVASHCLADRSAQDGNSAAENPATDGEPKESKSGDLFQRFTAYQNDRRITLQKGLLPGTYATTDADARNVKTGTEAVDRYALPNPKPAIYRFQVDPAPGTQYRQGIVQPAYGHAGGGVEVIFDNGTNAGSVSGPLVLPPI